MLRLLLVLVAAAPGFAQEPPKPRKSTFTVGKETTYVTGPLDKDGYVDYVAALNARLGKGVTAETNANVPIWKALGPEPEGGNTMPAPFFQLMGIDPPPAAGEYFIDLHKYARTVLMLANIEELYDEEAGGRQYPWIAKERPNLAAWLAAVEKPLNLVADGCHRPHYYSPIVPTRTDGRSNGLISALLPGVQKCRALATALLCRAMLRLGEGKTDAAWRDIMACHRLARFVGRGGCLIEGLVGIAIETLTHKTELAFLDRAGLDAKGIRACVRDLRALPPMPAVADAVDVGERFFLLETILRLDVRGVQLLDDFGLGGRELKRLPKFGLEGVDWDPALRDANHVMDRMAAAMREPDWARRQAALGRLEADFKKLKDELAAADEDEPLFEVDAAPQTKGKVIGEILLVMLAPSVAKMSVSGARVEQSWANLQAAFALAEYRADHKAFPKSLDELSPKYVAKVPIDLFTGKPLTYQPRGYGYLLYSFGVDGKDDEGRWSDDEPRGDDPRVLMPVIPPARK